MLFLRFVMAGSIPADDFEGGATYYLPAEDKGSEVEQSFAIQPPAGCATVHRGVTVLHAGGEVHICSINFLPVSLDQSSNVQINLEEQHYFLARDTISFVQCLRNKFL
jgi:hypothetical protein